VCHTQQSTGRIIPSQLRETVTIREKIEDLEKELDSIDGERSSTTKAPARRKKRRLSTAAAMGARWTTRKEKERLIKATAAKAKVRSSGAPLKERIIGSLKAAGKSGTTVKVAAPRIWNQCSRCCAVATGTDTLTIVAF